MIIYILGTAWELETISQDEAAARDCLGECRKDLRVISISAGLKHDVFLEVLFHEIGHAAWHLMDGKLKEKEEKAVTMTGTGLASFFTDSRNFDYLDGIL